MSFSGASSHSLKLSGSSLAVLPPRAGAGSASYKEQKLPPVTNASSSDPSPYGLTVRLLPRH